MPFAPSVTKADATKTTTKTFTAMNTISAYARAGIPEAVLKNEIWRDTQIGNPIISRIIGAMEEVADISFDAISNRSRKMKYTIPRFCAMYLIRIRTDLTFNEIGRIFNLDHASVIYAVKTVENRYYGHPQLLWFFTKMEMILNYENN